MANSRFAMAVHVISLLASRRGELQSSVHLASSINTNPVVVRRLMAELTKAGIVESVEGKSGGSRLRKCPEDVTLWEIYQALGEEELFAIHQNPAKKSCKISCEMKDVLGRVFGRAEAAAQAELKKVDVSQLLGKFSR